MRNCSTKTDTSRRARVNTACSITDLCPDCRTFPISARFLGLSWAAQKISRAFPGVVEILAALAQTSSFFIFQLMMAACRSLSIEVLLQS